MNKMKKIFSTLIFVTSLQFANAQCANTCGANLIVNGSFETATSNCSVNDIQLYSTLSPVFGWIGTEAFDANVMAGSTPDYFSACAGSTNSANNSCIAGSARVGVFTHTSFANGREYIQSELTAPLVAGKTYCFSMVVKSKVGAAGNIMSTCDGIGAWFHGEGIIDIDAMNGGQQFIGPGSIINAQPQIENAEANYIGATCVTVTGTFCATGDEEYIVIGNFRDDANTQITGTNPANYMYIDDVNLLEVCSTPLDVQLTSNTLSVCPGACASISSTASGSAGVYTYQWEPGSITTSTISVCPAVTTTYTLTTTSQTACGFPEIAVETITISVGNCFSGVVATGAEICSGTCATISAASSGSTGGILYTWQPGNLTGASLTICPTTSTIYTVTASDANGVSFTDTCLVSVVQTPVANAGIDYVICEGSSTTLTGSGSGAFAWSTNPIQTIQSIVVAPISTTEYTLTVSNGVCSSTDVVTISVTQLPSVQIQTSDITCAGLSNGFATATISGGTQPLSFAWNPGNINANTITNLSAGTYTFTVSDAAACNYSQTITITQPAPLTLQINGASQLCAGTSTNLAAQVTGGNSGYNYDWHGAGPNASMIVVSPIATTNYDLTVTDPQGCESIASHLINVSAPPIALFSGSDTLCLPFSTNFINQSQNAVEYTWLFGDGSSSNFENPTHTYTSAGIFDVSLIAESFGGCRDTFTVNGSVQAIAVPVNAISSAYFEVSEYEPTVGFNFESTNAVNCSVDFGDGYIISLCDATNYLHTYKDTGKFCAVFTSENILGCKTTSTACIKILPEFEFYIPNSFTPDGDGINDVFTGYGSNFTDFTMSIYNRWGEKIYESNEYEKPWDGVAKSKSEQSQVEVYIYSIKLKDAKGSQKDYNGQVNLIR
jgi:gliding motility-associated-like protein